MGWKDFVFRDRKSFLLAAPSELVLGNFPHTPLLPGSLQHRLAKGVNAAASTAAQAIVPCLSDAKEEAVHVEPRQCVPWLLQEATQPGVKASRGWSS